MDLFEEIPSFDIFQVPELLPELPEENPLPPKKEKVNLNDLNNPKRESYLKKIREKIEKSREKMSS